MNYVETIKYLNRFTNFEKQPFFSKDKLSLEKPRALFSLLGVDHQKLKYIHIAGTKGKGSTAQFCALILAKSGYKVGLYTSPHLVDFRERIKIVTKQKETMIGKRDLANIINDFQYKIPQEKVAYFTYFEVTTALAIAYFIKQKVDYVVLETGLGGRLDATNVVTPLVSVLTSIDFDHTHILGKTILAIAREKAGIIKDRGVVVSGMQNKKALKVIEDICKQKQARFCLEGRDFFVSNIVCENNATNFDFSLRNTTMRGLAIAIKGEHQVHNAALACAVCATLGKNLNFKSGLRAARLKGRFDLVSNDPLTIVDVAHNPVSFEKLAQTLRVYFPHKKVILVFACAKDKDAASMLKVYPWCKVLLPHIDNARLFLPRELKKMSGLSQIATYGSVTSALKEAKKYYDKDSLILVAGSFFLVGEFFKIRRLLPI
jgi:dihydrofolate synthase/folylpolyglutamate synthase